MSIRGRSGIAQRIRAVADGTKLAETAEITARGFHRNVYLKRMQILRTYRPDGWKADTRVLGLEHVEQALERGRGAILWAAPLVFHDLVTRMAFHRAGHPFAALSQISHGFTNTRLGARSLNRIHTAAENRFTRERFVMAPPQGAAGATDWIRAELGTNRLVSITVASRGKHTHRAPFFFGSMRIASGAPYIARTTGAALLPVFTLRRPDGSFETTIEPALAAPSTVTTEAAVAAVTEAMITHCAERAEAEPDQFSWLDTTISAPGDEGLER